jgi:hypothetical protein
MANGVAHGRAHRWAPLAAEEAHRYDGRVAPRSWVLLKWRKGVREVLVAAANRTRAWLTDGNFGSAVVARAERKEQSRGAWHFGVDRKGEGEQE